MTKEELAKIVETMPQGMDIDDYLLELVNRAICVDRQNQKMAEREAKNDPR